MINATKRYALTLIGHRLVMRRNALARAKAERMAPKFIAHLESQVRKAERHWERVECGWYDDEVQA